MPWRAPELQLHAEDATIIRVMLIIQMGRIRETLFGC